MRADVADRPERAAGSGSRRQFQSRVEQQPVLEVVAGHEPDVAERRRRRSTLARVLVERVEADVEVDRVDEAACRGLRRRGSRGLRGRHRQRLLADDVLAGREDRRACGTCRWFGEVTWTTSTAGSSRISSSEA